jgi:aminotransferase/cystathionine beta-lyase
VYNFEKLIDRNKLGSAKWIDMHKINPNVSDEVVPFSVADMEFEPPIEIREGLKSFIDRAVFGYSWPTEDYYKAVIGWVKKRHNWEIKAEQIVTSSGVIPSLYTAVRAFTEPGDGVLLFSPVYYPFFESAERNGRKVIESPLVQDDSGYHIDFEDFEKKASDPSAKLLFFCNPHNPVGRSWLPEELRRVGEICCKYDVIIVSDEIHFDLIMPGHQHTVFSTLSEEISERMLVCTAPSKSFNLAGMQVSNVIISNRKLKAQFEKELENTLGPNFQNPIGYEACRLAYTEGEKWLEAAKKYIYDNYLFAKEYLKENLPMVKVAEMEATYLLWMDFRAFGLSAEELREINVTKADMYFDEGYIFGEMGRGFERLNLACPRWVLEDGLKRLAKAYREVVK